MTECVTTADDFPLQTTSHVTDCFTVDTARLSNAALRQASNAPPVRSTLHARVLTSSQQRMSSPLHTTRESLRQANNNAPPVHSTLHVSPYVKPATHVQSTPHYTRVTFGRLAVSDSELGVDVIDFDECYCYLFTVL